MELARNEYCSIIQAGILEGVAIPFSRGSSQPRDQIRVSHIADRFFTIWATREGLDIPHPVTTRNQHYLTMILQTTLWGKIGFLYTHVAAEEAKVCSG